MALHSDLGNRGEAFASTYLLKQGYNVLEKNWHFGHEEIDIIAENADFIVFIEVKTRRDNSFGEPEFFVTRTKQRHLIKAANAYVQKKEIDKDVRFDIIGILMRKDVAPAIHHIEDAFYPTL